MVQNALTWCLLISSFSSKYGDLNDDIDDIIAIPDSTPLVSITV